jgi:hypothetical protein
VCDLQQHLESSSQLWNAAKLNKETFVILSCPEDLMKDWTVTGGMATIKSQPFWEWCD